MCKKFCVLLGNDFDDIEGITIINLLRRAGISIDTYGVNFVMISSYTKMNYYNDNVFKVRGDIIIDEYDGILLPGGPGVIELAENKEILSLVNDFFSMGKIVFGICGAPIILSNAGVLNGKNFTCLPSIRDRISEANYVDQQVVVDKNLVTSKSLGTSMEAALKLVELISSKEKADEMRKYYYID